MLAPLRPIKQGVPMRLRIIFFLALTSGLALALALLARTAPAEKSSAVEGSSAPVAEPSVGGGHPAPAEFSPVAAHSDAAGSADSADSAPASLWTLAGQLGGNVTDIAWLGDDFALLGFGPRVVVIDVSAPESPRWVATGPPLPDVVWGIAVAGDRAYVAAGDAGLFVLDASDPLNLQVSGSLDLPENTLDVQVAGDYAYLVTTDVGLRVVDVRDPTRLVEVGALETSEGRREEWSRLAVSGGMAVAVEQHGPVTIIDVRNPRQPRRVSEIESVAGDAMDVVITGDRALVAHRSPRLTVVDLAKMEHLSTYDVTASGELWSLAADGPTAYLADDRGAVHMLDVSVPDSPRSRGQVGRFDDVYVFDVTNLDAPEYKLAVGVAGESTTWTGGERYGIEMLAMGDRLVITDHDRSYWLDVSNPAAPQVLNWQGSWDAELADNAGLAASVPNLYFGTAHKLGILDLRDPATPRLAAILPIDTVGDVDYTTGIAASGPTVLVMSTDNFLRVIDTSSVANPREVGRVAVPAAYYAVVAAHADRAFALGMTGNLTVLDIASPVAPAVRQMIATAAPVDWVGFGPRAPVIAAATGRVYACAYDLGLLVYAPFEGTARTYLPTVYRSYPMPAP